jgi:cytidylate kinase
MLGPFFRCKALLQLYRRRQLRLIFASPTRPDKTMGGPEDSFMTDHLDSLGDDPELSPAVPAQTPRHGFRGEPALAGAEVPLSLTIAISRETGSRGASIAKRVGGKLGWQVYTQELLEYIAQEGSFRQDLTNQLTPPGMQWLEEHFNLLQRRENLSSNPTVLDLSRIILALGTQGDVVLLGRGAGCILPARSTLNVRLIAPLSDRIAYASQWLRLSEEEASEYVRKRDAGRAEFLTTHFHHNPDDVYQYDLLLNTSLLGEELSAELIYRAAQAKKHNMFQTAEPDPDEAD